MQLYEIEIEFLKVLFLGFFFGYSFFKVTNKGEASKNLREIKQLKYLELNKRSSIKNKRPV